MGLYLNGAYLYIWKAYGNEMRRILVAIILLFLMMLFFTIDEFVRPELTGPMMWFDNWRLWWICMLPEGALLYSSLILYIVVVIRCLYLRCKRHVI